MFNYLIKYSPINVQFRKKLKKKFRFEISLQNVMLIYE